MQNNGIYISGYFDDEDLEVLNEYEKELADMNVSLFKRNLKGGIYNSALDFADLEVLMFSYELIKSFVFSGSYDIIKHIILKLWDTTKKFCGEKLPFTVGLSGIPTINGTENIKCKIYGWLSKKQKEKVIEKTFELAKQIEEHQYELMKRSIYYNAFNSHVFSYDNEKEVLSEIDIEKEVKKKIEEQQNKDEGD